MVLSSWGDAAEDVGLPSSPRLRETGLSFPKAQKVLKTLGFGVLLVAAFLSGVWFFGQILEPSADLELARGVLPGEFERHEGFAVAWPGDPEPAARDALAQIVAAVKPGMRLVVLAPDKTARNEATSVLASKTEPDGLVYVKAPVDRMWVRDFGPAVIKSFGGGFELVDSGFVAGSTRTHASENPVSDALADVLAMENLHGRFMLNRGDILCNGSGLVLVSQTALDHNLKTFGYKKRQFTTLLSHYFGAEQIVYLPPLHSEPSGRLDVFAVMTGVNSVIVGQYDGVVDQQNAKHLDDIAKRLADLKTDIGPLDVHRIPMPPDGKGFRRSYTDVIYANDVLLFPHFSDVAPALEESALAVYRKLLPSWEIKKISADAVARERRALRCLVVPMFRLSNREPAGSEYAFDELP